MMSKASLQQGRRAVIAEGGEEAAVVVGGGAIAMGAVPVGAVGTEGATSSAVAVGYRRGVSKSAVVRPGGLVPASADGGRMGTAAIEGGGVIVEE